MDSVRWDHCSFSGYGKNTTPFLDSLDGVRFEQAYANAPFTPASVPSLLTSTYPLEDGHVVYREQKIIPEYFDDTSYTTGVAFNNIQIERFGYAERFDHGMDLSQQEVSLESTTDAEGSRNESAFEKVKLKVLDWTKNSKKLKSIARDTYYRFNELEQPHPTDRVVTDEAIEWIDNVEDPYFLWLHYMDTHHPYHFSISDFEKMAEEPFDPHRYARLLARAKHHIQSGEYVWELSDEERDYLIAAYDASLHHLNQQIERLFDTIDTEDTTVIVTSDHGEELWDRGHFGHAARPSKPRQMTLYEELLRVPLFVVGPETTSKTVRSPVSLVDVLPTILSVADVPVPSDVRGQSLTHYFSEDDEGEVSHEPIIAHATSPGDPAAYYEDDAAYTLATVYKGNYKYVHYENDDDELFDLAKDEGEKENRRRKDENIATELRERLLETLNDAPPETDDGSEEYDVEEQLRRLGYRD